MRKSDLHSRFVILHSTFLSFFLRRFVAVFVLIKHCVPYQKRSTADKTTIRNVVIRPGWIARDLHQDPIPHTILVGWMGTRPEAQSIVEVSKDPTCYRTQRNRQKSVPRRSMEKQPIDDAGRRDHGQRRKPMAATFAHAEQCACVYGRLKTKVPFDQPIRIVARWCRRRNRFAQPREHITFGGKVNGAANNRNREKQCVARAWKHVGLNLTGRCVIFLQACSHT